MRHRIYGTLPFCGSRPVTGLTASGQLATGHCNARMHGIRYDIRQVAAANEAPQRVGHRCILTTNAVSRHAGDEAPAMRLRHSRVGPMPRRSNQV